MKRLSVILVSFLLYLPLCAQEASLAVFVSEEAYEANKSRLSDDVPFFILPNVADESFL